MLKWDNWIYSVKICPLRSLIVVQKITNKEVLRCTVITTMYNTLSQRKLPWLSHVLRMNDERIPEDLLWSLKWVSNDGRPRLRYKDVCKRNLKSLNVDIDEWERLKSLLTTATNGDHYQQQAVWMEKIKFLGRKGRRNQNVYIFYIAIFIYFLSCYIHCVFCIVVRYGVVLYTYEKNLHIFR